MLSITDYVFDRLTIQKSVENYLDKNAPVSFFTVVTAISNSLPATHSLVKQAIWQTDYKLNKHFILEKI